MLTSLAERLVANELEQLDLEEAGLTAYFHGTGKKVTWQNKKAGTEVQQGTEIRLELGD